MEDAQRKKPPYRKMIIASVLIALTMPMYICDSESKLIDTAVAENPDRFVDLTHGPVHFERAGDLDSTHTVVLLHGFSAGMFIWDRNFDQLTESAQVIRFDFYGRGFSSRPNVAYDLELFVEQIEEFLIAMKLPGPVTLVAPSMAGPIAAAYYDRYPLRVRSIVFVAPAGFSVQKPASASIVTVPVIGDYVLRAVGESILKRYLVRNVHDPADLADLRTPYETQFQYIGYKSALRSTLKNMPLEGRASLFEKLDDVPVLLVWGEEDQVVPFAMHEAALAAMPHAGFTPLPETGHIPPWERPEEFNALLIDFLR